MLSERAEKATWGHTKNKILLPTSVCKCRCYLCEGWYFRVKNKAKNCDQRNLWIFGKWSDHLIRRSLQERWYFWEALKLLKLFEDKRKQEFRENSENVVRKICKSDGIARKKKWEGDGGGAFNVFSG